MKYNSKATDAKTPRPNCDLCPKDSPSPAAVDAKTRYGPWGYLCLYHHRLNGGKLGLGIGQVLLCGDDTDAELIEHYKLNDKENVS